MNRTEWLKVRLSAEEIQLLKHYAQERGWNMSQVIRELIRQLPSEKPL